MFRSRCEICRVGLLNLVARCSFVPLNTSPDNQSIIIVFLIITDCWPETVNHLWLFLWIFEMWGFYFLQIDPKVSRSSGAKQLAPQRDIISCRKGREFSRVQHQLCRSLCSYKHIVSDQPLLPGCTVFLTKLFFSATWPGMLTSDNQGPRFCQSFRRQHVHADKWRLTKL